MLKITKDFNDLETLEFKDVDLLYYQDDAKWLERKRTLLTGTDVSAIMGKNKFKTVGQVYMDKTAQSIVRATFVNRFLEFGRDAERSIISLFALSYLHFFDVYTSPCKSLIVNKGEKFRGGSLDGILFNKLENIYGVLEVKTLTLSEDSVLTQDAQLKKKGWLDKDGKSQIPENYYYQILHYLTLSELFKFAVMVKYTKFEDYRQELKQEFGKIEVIKFSYNKPDKEKMLTCERRFWTHVKNQDFLEASWKPA